MRYQCDENISLTIPKGLAASCRKSNERMQWLTRLPALLRELQARWALTLEAVFDSEEVSCSYVSLVTRANGASAVLKIGMPHMEGQQEIAGLRFWNGDPTVKLLDADEARGAALLERCEPGTALRGLAEKQQDVMIAGLLRRLWRNPVQPHSFRRLSALMEHWSKEALTSADLWPDKGLVREGLRLFEELPRTTSREVLLATDLHAGNVLQAQREPWLVIDPKPFLGDPAYDATQHLFNCEKRLQENPHTTMYKFADLLSVDRERVRLWTFARAAAEPRDNWKSSARLDLARALAP